MRRVSLLRDPAYRFRFSAALFLLLAAASVTALVRFYGGEFHRITGEAWWVWSEHRIAADEPEAFFLTREFDLPERREFVHIRVAADPQYTLWFNGREVGGGEWEGPWLDRYDVTPFARPEGNRIVLGIRSPRGVGGVLATVDLGSMMRSWLVTDESWQLYPRWDRALPLRDPEGAARPRLLGQPPFGRWNWLEQRPAETWPANASYLEPRGRERFDSWLPKVEVKSGVAVAGRIPATAEAFDFGPVRGRVEIRVAPGDTRAIRIRYANVPEELAMEGVVESLVVGEGETVVSSPAERSFRYLVVYEEAVEARVVK